MSSGNILQQAAIPHYADHIVSVKDERQFPNAEYVILEELGCGAFGTTYLAKRRNLGTPGAAPTMCVAKFLEDTYYPAKTVEAIFQQELRCMKRLRSAACVELMDAFVQSSSSKHFAKTPVLILEYMDGGDLEKMLNQLTTESYLSPAVVENAFVQLLLALHHIHSQHMLHRDMKTSNCLLSSSGLVKISDFGLSKMYDPSTSLDAPAKTYCGTKDFLAPERCRCLHYGRPADVWALAVIAYELMELQLPFGPFDDRERTGIEMAEAVSQPPRPFRYPEATYLRELLPRLLLPDPKERPSTRALLADPRVVQMVENFRRFVAGNAKISGPVREEINRSITDALADGATPSPEPLACTEDLDGWVHVWSHTQQSWTPMHLHVTRDTFELLESPMSRRGANATKLAEVSHVESNWQGTCFVISLKNGSVWQLHSREADWWIEQISMKLKKHSG